RRGPGQQGNAGCPVGGRFQPQHCPRRPQQPAPRPCPRRKPPGANGVSDTSLSDRLATSPSAAPSPYARPVFRAGCHRPPPGVTLPCSGTGPPAAPFSRAFPPRLPLRPLFALRGGGTITVRPHPPCHPAGHTRGGGVPP